jgi:hypothetical protein
MSLPIPFPRSDQLQKYVEFTLRLERSVTNNNASTISLKMVTASSVFSIFSTIFHSHMLATQLP